MEAVARRALRRAAVAQFLLHAYLQLIEWVPLSRWNNLARGNGQETLDVILAFAAMFSIWATVKRNRPVMIMALAGYVGWLWLQITTWGSRTSPRPSPRWERVYAIWFANNVRFLPAIDGNPILDAAHTVLHVLLVGAILAMGIAVLHVRTSSPKRRASAASA